jgi:hypothetical protein
MCFSKSDKKCNVQDNLLSEKIERCLIASAWIKPESQIVNTSEIFKIVNQQAPYDFLNAVFRTSIDSEDAEAIISTHYMEFKDQKISFRWYSFPHSKPAALDSILQKLAPSSITEMQALYIEARNYPTEMPPNTTVEELCAENLDEYINASNEGWSLSGAQAEKLKADVERDFKVGMSYRAFLARHKGIPAATAILRVVDGRIGFLQAGSCNPKHRGKGLYRALVVHRLNLLRSEKIEIALVSARNDTSAPICRKLGFELGSEIRCFTFQF